METLLETNDLVLISAVTAALKAEGIEVIEFDGPIAGLYAGIIPRRLMVAREDAFMARDILKHFDVGG